MQSLETQQLVDGVWTTVTVDVQRVMSNLRNNLQEGRKGDNASPNPFEIPPVIGLLSQTAFRTPLVKWIIPARLRDQNKRDVVFIGEDFVHIKEIEVDGHLRHIATKADFPAKIRAASVLGKPGRLSSPDTIKTEDLESLMDIDSDPVADTARQLLILTLANHEMMFLFTKPSKNDSVEFIWSICPLPGPTTLLDQPGARIAVDPHSRAIAVAAWRDAIMLYSTKTFERSHGDDSILDPVQAERPIRVNRVILAMDFLYPAADDPDHVIFVAVFTADRKTRVSCYEWDNSIGLSSLRVLVDGQQLSREESKPLLLIPLQWSSDFMLVGKDDIYIYRNILSGTAQSQLLEQNAFSKPPHLHGANQSALCVNWARVPRHSTSRYENYYLVREDGVIYYLDISSKGAARTTKCGEFQCSVDTAFAFLHVSLTHPDFLIAAGSSSPGELLSIGDQKYENEDLRPLIRQRRETLSPKYIESVPNWSPCVDLVLPPLKSKHGGRIFTLGGKNPYGAISEIRCGVEAKLVYIFDLELEGLTGVWAFDHSLADGTFFLFSFPVQSILWHSTDGAEDRSSPTTENYDLDMETETILAARLNADRIIQISRKRALILNLPNFSCHYAFELSQDAALIAAAVHIPKPTTGPTLSEVDRKPERPLVVMAIRTRSELELSVFRYDESQNLLVKTGGVSPPSEPTCLSVLAVDHCAVVIAGTADGHLVLYRIDPDGGLSPAESHEMKAHSESQPNPGHDHESTPVVCDSVVTVRIEPTSRIFLVCGTRNGLLCIISVLSRDTGSVADESRDSTQLVQSTESTIHIGSTPVRLIESAGSILVLCDSAIHRLNIDPNSWRLFSVQKVWFTDRNQPDLEQSTISAILPRPHDLRLTNSLTRSLICVSKGRLLVAQLNDYSDVITRRMAILGSPYRAIYCDSLACIVVAASQLRIQNTEPNENFSLGSQATIYSMLQFVELGEYEGAEENEEEEMSSPYPGSTDPIQLAGTGVFKRIRAVHELYPLERANSLANWVLQVDSNLSHHLVIAGTEISEVKYRSKGGRLVFLQPRTGTGDRLDLKVVKSKDCPAPVYAVADIGVNRIAYCSGTTLHVASFSLTDNRLSNMASYELFSPATQLSVDFAGNLNATTAAHSLFSFRFSSPTEDSHILEPVFSDERNRNSLNHLSFLLPEDFTKAGETKSLILISDKSCSLAGIWEAEPSGIRYATHTLFEASLPRSIIRLRRGNIKPVWFKSVPCLTPAEPAREKEGNDILGLTSDGTLYSLTILNASSWSILKFLELLIKVRKLQSDGGMLPPYVRDKRLRDLKLKMLAIEEIYTGEDTIQRLLEPSDYHVNGDLFHSLLNAGDFGSISLEVRHMLQDAGNEFMETWNNMLACSEVVAQARLGTKSKAADGHDSTQRHRIAIEWMVDVLTPLL